MFYGQHVIKVRSTRRLFLGKNALGIQVTPVRQWRSSNLTVRKVIGRASVAGEIKGSKFKQSSLRIKRAIGEGSFGEVFEGEINDSNSDVVQRVVLKRVKSRVQGAEQMGQMEHALNVIVKNKAPNSCADFLGYCEVSKSNGKLTRGTWLVWRYEGQRTLWYYLHRRDGMQQLAEDLGIDEASVPATVMKDVFQSLEGLHTCGLVHRDVKPANLVLCEEIKKFKLIDLGACADLRSGTNFIPDESILDPIYCAPEQYILPTDAPDISKTFGGGVVSTYYWNKFKPDRFDMYSAGMVLVQMAIPSLRSEKHIKQLKKTLKNCNYNFARWRKVARLSQRDSAILDQDNGAGWQLLEKLLQPRRMQETDDGNVIWKDEERLQRPSAAQAQKYRFVKQAQARRKGTLSGAEEGARQSAGDAKGFMGKLWSFLQDSEVSVQRQISATELQRRRVEHLEVQVEAGEATVDELKDARQRHQDEQFRLADMSTSINQVFSKLMGAAETIQPDALDDDETIDQGQNIADAKRALKRHAQGFSSEEEYSDEQSDYYTSDEEGASRELAANPLSNIWQALDDTSKEYRKKMEKEAKHKDKQRMQEQVFAGYLERAVVKAHSFTKYEDLAAHLPPMDAPQFNLISAKGRERVYLYHRQRLLKKYKQLNAQREGGFRELLEFLDLPQTTTFAKFEHIAARDPRFNAVLSTAHKEQLFTEYQTEMRQLREQEEKVQAAEVAFKKLLQEQDITSATVWAEVKKGVWSDSRYEAISEYRRKELFEEYKEVVGQVEQLKEEETPQASKDSSSEPSEQYLDEYHRLEQDLQRMKEKIKLMEQRLTPTQSSSTTSNNNKVMHGTDSDEVPLNTSGVYEAVSKKKDNGGQEDKQGTNSDSKLTNGVIRASLK